VHDSAVGTFPQGIQFYLSPCMLEGTLDLTLLFAQITQPLQGFQGQAAQALSLKEHPLLKAGAAVEGKTLQEPAAEQLSSSLHLSNRFGTSHTGTRSGGLGRARIQEILEGQNVHLRFADPIELDRLASNMKKRRICAAIPDSGA
jgi:hypothetical protein